MKKWFKEFQEHPFTLVQIGKEKQKLTYLTMWHRMIALALVCCMVVTLLPVTALAAEEKPAVESGAEEKKAEPAKAEPAKAEPAKAEPAKAEPAKAEPAKAEPAKAVSDPQVTSRAVTETSWDIGKTNAADIKAVLSVDQTTLTISGKGEMKDWSNVRDVPWAQAVSTINKVTIAEGVTTIGKNAFVGCLNMSICTLPTTLTTMGDFIFKDCKTLTSITIPEGVTTMGRAIFTNCMALTSITIPESVKVIWWEVFSGCSNLATVTLNVGSEEGKNKKFIQANAFLGINENLTIKVNAKNDANTFKEWSSTLLESGKGTVATVTDATKATTALTNVPSACTITATYGAPPAETTWDIGKTNAADIKAVLSADQKTLTISGKGEMKDWAQKSQVPWQNATNNITTVTIAEGVTTIGNHAFFQCSKLNTITLPATLTSIGDYAFYGCGELISIPIPKAVTTIGSSAFKGCVKLSSIPIPEGVTTIGYRAFEGCRGLTGITIPEKVTAIEWSTFSDCDNLTSIIIPEAVTAIGQEAFYGCSKLATVTMNFSNDKNSKIIDGSVFQGIKDKATINVNAKNDAKSFKAWSSTLSNVGTSTAATFTDTVAASTTLTNVPSACTITAKYEAPPTETSWDIGKTNAADIKAVLSADQKTLTISGKGEMKDWPEKIQVPWQKATNNITTVTIAEGVTNIGNYAFFQCGELNTITLPTTLTSIGNYAFYSCVGLTSIPIPKAVTTIDHSAFNNCVNLTSISIPEGVTTIGNSAFIGCTKLTSITIPEKVTAIEWSTFYGCDNLTSIIIPEAVTTIEENAFYGCSKLATVTMNFSNDKNSKKIDGSVFQGIKDKATINVNAKNDAKSFKAWSSTLSNVGTGTAATFTDTAAASTTLTNVPSACTITAEYAHGSVTDGMIQTIGDQQYTGSAIEPVLTVQAGNKKLALGTDYTVTYGNNINAGTATATIAGAGKYTGTASKTFQINKAEGTKVKGYAVPGTLKAITNVSPKLSNVTLDGKGDGVWKWNTDKDLTADNNNKKQTFKATFTPTDIKNYNTVEVDVKVSVSKLSIAIDGSQLRTLTKGTKEALTNHITVVGAELKEGTDYNTKLTVSKVNIVSVTNNEIIANNVGTVKVTVDVMVGEIKAASDYIVAKVESKDDGEHSKNTADEIKDLTNDVLNEENPPKEIVDAVADATIKMDAEEKAKLEDETVKKLDKLFASDNPMLEVKNPIIEHKDGVENRIGHVDITGLALAAGLTSEQIKKGDTVQVKIEQEQPAKVVDGKKAQMQLRLTLLVNGKKAKLESPLVIDIQLDKNMKTAGLEIEHKHDDGKIDILTEGAKLTAKNFIINKETKVLTMRLTSFSTLTFTTAAEKPLDPTPSKPKSNAPSSTMSTITKPSAPNTGDSTPLGAMVGVVMLGLASITGLVWKKKYR